MDFNENYFLCRSTLSLSLSLSLPEMPDRAAGLLERQKDRQKPREREKILIAALIQLCYMQVNKCIFVCIRDIFLETPQSIGFLSLLFINNC